MPELPPVAQNARGGGERVGRLDAPHVEPITQSLHFAIHAQVAQDKVAVGAAVQQPVTVHGQEGGATVDICEQHVVGSNGKRPLVLTLLSSTFTWYAGH